MEILNKEGTKEICNIPFDIKSIQDKEIYSDKIHMLIPIQDKEILKAISYLVYDTVMTNEPEWMYPDYDNSKLALFINMDSEKFDVCLSIEAIPPKYTEKEKELILSQAKGESAFTASDWRMIFASAEAWHNKENNCGEIRTYPIEMTREEESQLMWELFCG